MKNKVKHKIIKETRNNSFTLVMLNIFLYGIFEILIISLKYGYLQNLEDKFKVFFIIRLVNVIIFTNFTIKYYEEFEDKTIIHKIE